jgi:phage terminase large subunit-like protein
MQSLAERLATAPLSERAGLLDGLTEDQMKDLLHDWEGFNARPNQIEPAGEWYIWLLLAGRGFGKTRTGAEWIRKRVANGARHIALVAETAADARDVMVEGESGLLGIYPKADRPLYEPSKRRVTWPNGAQATLFNATEPDQLRGPQFDTAWTDEIAKWRYARETWDMLQFGMRLGVDPRVVVTTTPRPIELVKAIVAGQEGKVIVTRGSTMDNASNLAASFMERIKARYAGTRLGRQELEAEILGDMPGALWTMAMLDAHRINAAPIMGRIVVAVDPAVTNTEDSDEHGIIVAGMTTDKRGMLLEDASIKGSPNDWARRAVSLYRSWEADAIVVEVNQGGDMVAQTIRTIDPNVKIREVRASRGKHVRAEPIAALYEQGKIGHVGSWPELENQMTQMTASGYQGDGSPDRLDAAVWAFTELFPAMVQRVPPARAPVISQPRYAPGARRG